MAGSYRDGYYRIDSDNALAGLIICEKKRNIGDEQIIALKHC
jgi:hypothetical protein